MLGTEVDTGVVESSKKKRRRDKARKCIMF